MSPGEGSQQEFLLPFREAMVEKRKNPDGNDVRISAFASGVGTLIAEHKHVADSIQEFAYLRRSLSPNVQVNLLLRALSKQFLKDPEGFGGYPERFDDPSLWYMGARRVMCDEEDSITSDNFYVDLWTRNIQSNKSERYKVLPLLTEIYADRFSGRDVSILDIGASQNQGLKQLRLAREYPFHPVRTYKDTGIKTRPQQKIVSQIINEAVHSSISLGQTVGSDIVPPDDPEVKEWTKSCSFYPSELLDKEKVACFDALSGNVKDVEFVCADATKPNQLQQAIDKEKFSIAFACTMLYMLNDAQRSEVIKGANDCLEDNGLLVVQDFAKPDPVDPKKLIFHKIWTPWRYSTMVLDKREPEKGFQEIINWKNGRCDEMAVKLGSKATELFFR